MKKSCKEQKNYRYMKKLDYFDHLTRHERYCKEFTNNNGRERKEGEEKRVAVTEIVDVYGKYIVCVKSVAVNKIQMALMITSHYERKKLFLPFYIYCMITVLGSIRRWHYLCESK